MSSTTSNSAQTPITKPKRVPLEYVFALFLFGPLAVMMLAKITDNDALGELGAWMATPLAILIAWSVSKAAFTKEDVAGRTERRRMRIAELLPEIQTYEYMQLEAVFADGLLRVVHSKDQQLYLDTYLSPTDQRGSGPSAVSVEQLLTELSPCKELRVRKRPEIPTSGD
jgi:hypothetical protein